MSQSASTITPELAPACAAPDVFRFELWPAEHPRWHEGLCFVRATYRAQGLPMTPEDDRSVVRLCALDAVTGNILGSIGFRQQGFSCARSFPSEFAGLLGSAAVVEFTQFAVAPGSRRLKVTLALLSTIFSHVRALGVQFAVCETRPTHASFYALAGMREAARQDMENWPPKLFLVGDIGVMTACLQRGPLRKRGLPQ